MSTVQTLQIESTSSEATEQLGERLGNALRGGEVVELVSDLGGGKTTLVRGLVRGAGSNDRVASPTFTISRVYNAPSLEIHHFDFYRLNDAGLAAHELHDIIGEPDIATVVEWGEVVGHVLPEDRLTIRLTRSGDEGRELSITYPKKYEYLAKAIQGAQFS